MPEQPRGGGETEPHGVYAAALTPVDGDLAPDCARLVRHCRWLLDHGCNGLAVLGTTGEANSFSVDERLLILDALAEAGIPGAALLPGTGCCALPDSVRLTRHAVELGVAGVLMLPPFYIKNVSDDGLFASYAEIIERVGNHRLRVYLYHFPQMSATPLSFGLIERLLKAYPDTVAGIKDSSGDLGNMVAMARNFPTLRVFAGTERFLAPVLKAGGAGCITAGANVLSSPTGRLYDLWCAKADEVEIDRMQEEVTRLRLMLEGFPMIAAMKAMVARHTGDGAWANVRPPLVKLAPGEVSKLLKIVDQAGLVLP